MANYFNNLSSKTIKNLKKIKDTPGISEPYSLVLHTASEYILDLNKNLGDLEMTLPFKSFLQDQMMNGDSLFLFELYNLA